MSDTAAEDEICDDPETCRKGRVWLGWYAGVLVAFMIGAAIAGDAATQGQSQASEFAYARENAALQVAATFADTIPHGY